MRFVLLIFRNPRNPNSKRMSKLANNLESASKREKYGDKKYGSNFNVECSSLKKPRAKNSRMAQEGNRFNVGRNLVHQPICLQFQRWGNCGFGEKCRYVHTTGGSTYGPPQGVGCDQRYLEGGKGEYRETAAITIGSAGSEVKNKSYSDNVEPQRSVDFRRNLKTRLCIRWERHGSCYYGSRCQFAHGKGELQVVGYSDPLVSLSSAGISAPAENVAFNETGSSAPSKLRFKWNDVHRISRIYGDWIE